MQGKYDFGRIRKGRRARGHEAGVCPALRRGEYAPHFLWSCQRKRAAPGPKEKRCGAKRHVVPFLLKTWGPNKKPWAVEARFSVGRGPSLAESFSHQPATGNCEAGVQNRLDLLLFSLSLPVLNPGREIQRGGTAVPPLYFPAPCQDALCMIRSSARFSPSPTRANTAAGQPRARRPTALWRPLLAKEPSAMPMLADTDSVEAQRLTA